MISTVSDTIPTRLPAMHVVPDWVAVDWGTTHLRAWAIDNEGNVSAAAQSDRGMGQLSSHEFEPALLDMVEAVLTKDRMLPVVACGMVGARTGWIEAPYVTVPAAPADGAMAVSPLVSDPRLRVHILCGMCQMSHPDVLRGEETQISGFMQGNPEFAGTLCLPGTHSKWIELSQGHVTSFRTSMTGELFALLAKQSVLRSVVETNGFDMNAFDQAVQATIDGPADILHRLFEIRAAALLQGLDGPCARARLSGLLVGADVASWRPSCQKSGRVEIIGESGLATLYAHALGLHGVQAQCHPAETLTLMGLKLAHTMITER